MSSAPYETPELLDRDVDMVHRSYLSAVTRTNLEVLRLRTPRDLLRLDERWFGRYVFTLYLNEKAKTEVLH